MGHANNFGIVSCFFLFRRAAEVIPLQKLNQSEQAQRIAGDFAGSKDYRDGLAKVMAFANTDESISYSEAC